MIGGALSTTPAQVLFAVSYMIIKLLLECSHLLLQSQPQEPSLGVYSRSGWGRLVRRLHRVRAHARRQVQHPGAFPRTVHPRTRTPRARFTHLLTRDSLAAACLRTPAARLEISLSGKNKHKKE